MNKKNGHIGHIKQVSGKICLKVSTIWQKLKIFMKLALNLMVSLQLVYEHSQRDPMSTKFSEAKRVNIFSNGSCWYLCLLKKNTPNIFQNFLASFNLYAKCH